jgi:hypothetical protein
MVSLPILLGILTLAGLFVTVILGILMTKGKKTFKLHKFVAYLTLLLAIIHALIIISRYY